MADAESILQAIKGEWRNVEDIKDEVAGKFGELTHEISDDIDFVVEELVCQGFVKACAAGCEGNKIEAKDADGKIEDKIEDDKVSPIRDFCERHNIPYEIHIDLTDACTECCVHCYVPHGQSHYLCYEDVENVLREFRRMNGFSVQLTGGECMMHPDFRRICSLCKDLQLNLIILSNLTLCDEGMVSFLKRLDPQLINVSLYSMDPDEHDMITQVRGSWYRTMDAILRCHAMSIPLRIAAPLLKINKNNFGRLKQFASSIGAHFIPSYDIIAQSNHNCRNLLCACSASEFEEVLETERDIFDRGWDGRMPGATEKVCGIGRGMLYVSARGDYYPCDSMHEYVLGNVNTNTVEEIWNGEKLNYLRSLRNVSFTKCVDCEHRPYCKVCPASNFNATNSLFTVPAAQCALSAVLHRVYGGK